MNNILIPRTRNVPSSILPKFDCYNRVSLNSLANENLYLTCFSINSGLTHTNICGCIQLLNDIWYSVLPGSNDCMVHTNKLELVSMWHTSDSDGAYSRVPYYYDSGILLELHQWRFFWPTIPIYHLTWEFIVLLSRHPTSPVVHSVVSEPKRDSSMFFLSIDSRTHEICWQEMDLWCIISKYMDVLKGEGSLLLSTQPNIQSCYFTVSSHKHTHAIQFTLPVGKGIFKRYHSYGYVWFLHTKPSPLYGLHTPGFSTQMHTIHSPSLLCVEIVWWRKSHVVLWGVQPHPLLSLWAPSGERYVGRRAILFSRSNDAHLYQLSDGPTIDEWIWVSYGGHPYSQYPSALSTI